MKVIKKRWFKWFSITVGSFLGVLFVLAIIYSQFTFKLLFNLGNFDVHSGNNERGNNIMNYAISKFKNVDDQIYHSLSVQNTKNGNYNISIPALEKALSLNPKEVPAYYGWVLLYYYHDYEKALEQLENYDAFTPGFSDAPMGEDIHYLKGLAHMQLENYEKAIEEFDIYITQISSTHGEDWVDVYAFVNKGRCLASLNQFIESIDVFQTAINNDGQCTEAYYFMGMSQIKTDQKEKACLNFNTALHLIGKGYKSSDYYVEYFHEVYEQQIQNSISEICSIE